MQKSEIGLSKNELALYRPSRKQHPGSYNKFHLNWAYPLKVVSLVSRLHKGTILNFPCGSSQFGDLRVDVDRAVKPDVIADLYHPPFRDKAFGTIHCDPPYFMLARTSWTQGLFALAERVIIEGPVNIWKGSIWQKRFFIIDSNFQYFRVLQVFDRKRDKKQKRISAFLRPRPKG